MVLENTWLTGTKKASKKALNNVPELFVAATVWTEHSITSRQCQMIDAARKENFLDKVE